MNDGRITTALGAFGAAVLTVSGLHAQTPQETVALASATAVALEPGVRAALKDGDPISFEHQSPWGQTVKRQLEEALGLSFTTEHRRGASRILLGSPHFDDDTATVEVWFGRCEVEATTESEILKIRIYSFTFQRDGHAWSHLRSSRLGTAEGNCDGDLQQPAPVQT